MSTSLDFSILTTRQHRPSAVSILTPRSALKKKKKKENENIKKDTSSSLPPLSSNVNNSESDGDVILTTVCGDNIYMITNETQTANEKNKHKTFPQEIQRQPFKIETDIDEYYNHQKLLEQKVKLHKLTCDLVRQTQFYSRLSDEDDLQQQIIDDCYDEEGEDEVGGERFKANVLTTKDRIDLEEERKRMEEKIPCKYHEMELADWETSIDWDGVHSNTTTNNTVKGTVIDVDQHPKGEAIEIVPLDPDNLLQEPLDPELEAMDFSKSVSWDGAASTPTLISIPLILHKTIAATSIVRLLAPQKRPEPFAQTEAYGRRYEREMNGGTILSTAGISSALNPDNEQLEKIIAERQAKRAQMAIDKSHRVTEAMGTLALGGGKGRTITSSLMGPGGTERTGRPSRHAGSSQAHDAEQIEQLDLVYNHSLVKPDLRKSELRQFHRPRLPRSVVRIDRPWQYQIRILINAQKKKGPPVPNAPPTVSADGSTVISSYAAAHHSSASSRNKIRNEADLSTSTTDGFLVLFEYCEERPPCPLSKGMASKIMNYYRGDRSKCPISAGGGDRPTRKRHTSDNDKNTNASSSSITTTKSEEVVPKLSSGKNLSVADLVGIDPKKRKKKNSKTSQQPHPDHPAVDILPEGVTEVLHPKVHGPFIGEIEEGMTQSGLISNLFAAPIFRHEPPSTDFLMILDKRPPNNHNTLGVILRPMPVNVYTVGQTEPRVKVFAPNTTGEKNFTAPFITYQIAKALERTERKEGRGLRFDEINDRLFANTTILPNALRQRIKQVAMYDKNTQIWTTKPIGLEDYPGVDALGRKFTPEGVAAYESACAGVRRLCDIGIHELHSGSSSVVSVGQAMVYLNGKATAARERKSKMSKMAEFTKKNTKNRHLMAVYEKAAQKLDAEWREVKRKQDVARFIYEELQLAPWHLTSEFIEVHKNAQGTAMMKLTGLGDPSGRGEAYNFLREVDAKPNKNTNNTDGALNAQIKKITGTENDLRKLTMKQMASLLRSYGMGQKEIDTLKRWDRVHVIRDLSTKAASDGMGDGLERYARGEKMKLSDQKQMYRDRIQEIWRRQRAALSTEAGVDAVRSSVGAGGTVAEVPDAGPATKTADPISPKKQTPAPPPPDIDDSDSDSDDDDDLVAALEEDMLDVRQTNRIVADHVMRSGDAPGGSSAVVVQRNQEETQEMSKDARELAALMRQREEERAAQEGLKKGDRGGIEDASLAGVSVGASVAGRKVIRRRITKTFPDGTQTVTFKFIVREEEVDRVLIAKKKKEDKEIKEAAKAANSPKKNQRHTPKKKHHHHDFPDSGEPRIVGHAMFEDDDDYQQQHKPKLSLQLHRSTRVITTTKTTKVGSSNNSHTHMAPKAPPKLAKRPKLQIGKLKSKMSQDKMKKKRKREAEEADLYSAASKRKGNSNRRERGAARDRMPHVIFADKLEQIRLAVEKRPHSGPFHRPVNRRQLPRYYEIISEPIDLQTIRDKNQRYEYRTVDTFLRDFELMKNNAVKFNGPESILADEATAIYEMVRTQVEQNRPEFQTMEEAVREQMSSSNQNKKKKKSKTAEAKTADAASSNGDKGSVVSSGSLTNVLLDGVETTVNLGDLTPHFGFGDGGDSDSDDSNATPIKL